MSSDSELEQKFWNALEASPFMMVGLQGFEDSRARPMSAQVDGADASGHRSIYFFANRSEHLFQGLSRSNRVVATFASKGHDLFANVHGTLVEDNDRARIDRFWNPAVASWYEGGRDDPELVLLRFNTEKAEIWEARTGSAMKAAVMKLLGRDPGATQRDHGKAEVRL